MGDIDLQCPNLNLSFTKGLNLLIGENDSGKSAILEAIKMVLRTHAYERLMWVKEEQHTLQNGSDGRMAIPQDELIIFSPYWGTCGFRIYDIRETPRAICLKPVSKTDFDEARLLFVAPEEGVLLVWWRGCIVKFKIQKNADHSVSGFKYIDAVYSPGPSDFFLTYILEEPD